MGVSKECFGTIKIFNQLLKFSSLGSYLWFSVVYIIPVCEGGWCKQTIFTIASVLYPRNFMHVVVYRRAATASGQRKWEKRCCVVG